MENKREYWRKLIAEQEASRQRVQAFCRGRGIGQYSFYRWRKRLQPGEPARFARLETAPAVTASSDSALELVLRNGDRLRIGHPVDAATLRMVLEVVRG